MITSLRANPTPYPARGYAGDHGPVSGTGSNRPCQSTESDPANEGSRGQPRGRDCELITNQLSGR